MLDQAFEALKTYDWGAERSPLEPINEAVISSRNDAVARKDLEARLIAALKTPISRDAKDYVCRKLMQIGTAASVSTVAELLADKDLSHMARFALEPACASPRLWSPEVRAHPASLRGHDWASPAHGQSAEFVDVVNAGLGIRRRHDGG